MAKQPTITTVTTGYYGRQALNTNFENIRDQFDNTLSLDGSTPNSMNADFDLNGNDLLNGKDGEFTNSLTVKGVDILDALGGSVGPATVFKTTNRFTGDGTTVSYTLSKTPAARANTDVFINGVYQQKDTYTVSGTTLTFSEAPPAVGFEVVIYEAIDVGAVDASSVTTSDGQDVQAKFDQGFYPTRSAFVTDVAAGKVWAEGDVVSANGFAYKKVNSSSLISALPNWEPVGVWTPNHFGAVGDGVTDDGDALRAWATNSTGQTLYVPAGKNYLGIIPSAASKLVFRAGCTVTGTGTITLQNSSAVYMEFVSVQASNITIDGPKFVGNIFAGSSGFFFLLGNNTTPTSNVRFLRGSLDLQNSISGGTGVHSVHGFSFARSFTDHTWDGWTFTRCNYATIKNNGDTSSHERIRIVNCLFKNNVRGNMTGFNSPSGTLRNVVVSNNHFIRESAYFIDIQDQTLMGGVVHGENVTITGNTAYGYGRDVIHCEELTGPVTVSNNSWTHLGGGEDGGITFRSNTVGGGVTGAERIAITGNTGKVDGAAVAGSNGIWFVWDGDGEPGGKHIVVTGNTLTGYETGIYTGDAELGLVSGNYISGSTYGIYALYPSQSVKGNTVEGATVGLRHNLTGIWGRNTFIDCADLFAGSGTETRVMAVGWDVQLRNRTIVNGATNTPYNLTLLPTEMVGFMDYVMRYDSASRSHYSASVSSTGGVLGTVTRRFRVSFGNPYISTTDANLIINNAGDLAVTASNSSGADRSIDLMVSFTGSWMQ